MKKSEDEAVYYYGAWELWKSYLYKRMMIWLKKSINWICFTQVKTRILYAGFLVGSLFPLEKWRKTVFLLLFPGTLALFPSKMGFKTIKNFSAIPYYYLYFSGYTQSKGDNWSWNAFSYALLEKYFCMKLIKWIGSQKVIIINFYNVCHCRFYKILLSHDFGKFLKAYHLFCKALELLS